MNGIARLSGPWNLALSLAFGLSLFSPFASGVAAAPISYSTKGHIYPWQYGNGDVPGYQGENVISFTGVTGGTVDKPGTRFSLGDFQMAPLPPGEITYYNNTAFAIDLTTSLGGNVTPSSTVAPYSGLSISGVLYGVAIGGDLSGVVAMIKSVEPNPPIPLLGPPGHPGPVPVLDLPFSIDELGLNRPILLNPSSQFGGRTPLNTVPEPTTIALLLVGSAGVGLRRRARFARNA